MKRPRSIITKLTILYSIIILSVCIILFFTFFFITNRYLIYETDRSLLLHASQIAFDITYNKDEHSKSILEMAQKETPGMFIQILDASGKNSDGSTSEFEKIALNAIKSKDAIYLQQKIGNSEMRLISYPIVKDTTVLGTIIMGHQIDVYKRSLQQLKTVGIISFMMLIIPAIILGYYLAKSAINPITKFSKDMNRISSENLSGHIEMKTDTKEVSDLIKNFNSLLDRLHSSFTLEQQFLGEMAHEIKTPLAVIKSNSEVTLAKERKPEEYQKSIKQTLSQIDKLTKNLLSLMDFAWAKSSDSKNQFSLLNLSNLLQELVQVAEYGASPKNIEVEANIENNIFVIGKSEKLYQAFYNIIDNAIKFTDNNGHIFIILRKINNKAEIEIKDDGIGIDKDILPHIFDRFYRSGETKNIAGNGLGLAITESIIQAHGGIIEVESEKNKGSSFKIALQTDIN